MDSDFVFFTCIKYANSVDPAQMHDQRPFDGDQRPFDGGIWHLFVKVSKWQIVIDSEHKSLLSDQCLSGQQ